MSEFRKKTKAWAFMFLPGVFAPDKYNYFVIFPTTVSLSNWYGRVSYPDATEKLHLQMHVVIKL